MADHSLLSPSAAHRWSRCPASLVKGKDYPETTSEHAEDGRRAHDLAMLILTGQNTVSDAETSRFVSLYTDRVRKMSAGAVITMTEKEVPLVFLGPNEKGTVDHGALLRGGELQVHDLKYGKGVQVFAKENEQLILYALGLYDLFSLLDDIKTVRLCIHQPRLDHYDEWVVTVEELEKWRKKLVRAAGRALSMFGLTEDLLVYSPGDKQCRWCLHKKNCEALAKHCTACIASDFDDPMADVKSLAMTTPVGRMAYILKNLDLITKWAATMKEAALERLQKGEAIPGWKLVAGRAGNRKWSNEEEVEAIMKSMRLRVEEMYDMKLISPASAEKLLKKNPRKWSRLRDLATRSEPAPTIAPEEDKRPALESGCTAESFEEESLT